MIDDFHEARAAYDACREAYYETQRAIVEMRSELTTARALVEALEAEVIANGGAGGAVIDGKNAETRAAQLTCILALEPRYTAAKERTQMLEADIARTSAAVDDAANRMSAARRVMDWAIARIQHDAATEAARGIEREAR